MRGAGAEGSRAAPAAGSRLPLAVPATRRGALGVFIATPPGSVVSCRCLQATGPFPVPSARVAPLSAPLESGGGGFLPSSVDILRGKTVPPRVTSLPQAEESRHRGCAFPVQLLEIYLTKIVIEEPCSLLVTGVRRELCCCQPCGKRRAALGCGAMLKFLR